MDTNSNIVNNATMISRDVIVIELKELNWDKNQRRDTIRVIFDESKSTEEAQVEKKREKINKIKMHVC